MFREQVNFEINYATVTRSSINPLKKVRTFSDLWRTNELKMIAPQFFANVSKRITIFCAMQIAGKICFENIGAPINHYDCYAEKLELLLIYVEFYELF